MYDDTELYDKIRDLLTDSVTDIFLKLQEEYNIECGDCPPDVERDLDDSIDELSETIKVAFKIQLD